MCFKEIRRELLNRPSLAPFCCFCCFYFYYYYIRWAVRFAISFVSPEVCGRASVNSGQRIVCCSSVTFFIWILVIILLLKKHTTDEQTNKPTNQPRYIAAERPWTCRVSVGGESKKRGIDEKHPTARHKSHSFSNEQGGVFGCTIQRVKLKVSAALVNHTSFLTGIYKQSWQK